MKKLTYILAVIFCLIEMNGCGGGVETPPPPPTAVRLTVSSTTGGATAGTPFNISVTAVTGTGTVASSYAGTIHLMCTDAQAVLPKDSALAGGMASFQVTFKTAGSQTVTASDLAGRLTDGTLSAVNVSPAVATQFMVTAPSTSTVGIPFTVNVSALDTFQNIATNYAGAVHFSSSDAQAVLPTDSALSAGVASLTVTLKTKGSQTISVTDTQSAVTAKSGAISVTDNSATHFGVGLISGAEANTRAPLQLAVTPLDAANNVAAAYSGTVHFSSSDAKAMLPANTAVTGGGVTGLATTFETAGTQSITATDTSNDAVTGSTGPVVVTQPAALAITSGPLPDGTVGVDYGPEKMVHQKCVFSGGSTRVGWNCTEPCFGSCLSLPLCYSSSPCHLVAHVFQGYTFKGDGGIPAYTWRGELAPGLTVDPSGKILGTPTATGTWTGNITLTDSGQPTAQTTGNFPVKVKSNPPVIGAVPVPQGATLNQPYSFVFQATQGLQPYTWSETGTLPPGLSLGASSGTLSGKPTRVGAFPLTVNVKDSAGQTAPPQDFIIQVFAHGFAVVGNMTDARVGHTATLLSGGKVLLAGGSGTAATLSSAEVFDPTAGTFSATGKMQSARTGHTATVLCDVNAASCANPRVLVAGGAPDKSAELYDPITGTFAFTSSLTAARFFHTATLLPNGKVLIVGGDDPNTQKPLATAELFDPVAGIFSATGNLTTARAQHTATLLSTGKVLITGGEDENGNPLASAELYDPATEQFATVQNMTAGRSSHTATLLSGGKVLIAGGLDENHSPMAAIEVFDPSTGLFSALGNLVVARNSHTAVLLGDGTVLLAGGEGIAAPVLADAEIFDPATGKSAETGALQLARFLHTATLLANGRVLVAGGSSGESILGAAEIYQ